MRDEEYEPEFPEPEVKHRLLKGIGTVAFFAFLMWFGRWYF
jgi:hypothetical protein